MEQWSDVLKPLLPHPNTRLDVSADNAGCQYHFGRHLKPSHARIDQSKSRCSPPNLYQLRREFVQALGTIGSDHETVRQEQAARLLLVDDVHLQGEHHASLVDQSALFVVEIAVLGALRSIGSDLVFVARVGAEHPLQIAAVDMVARVRKK